MDLIDYAISFISFENEPSVLVSCAGKGALAQPIREKGADVECFEINPGYYDFLVKHGFKMKGRNFVVHDGEPEYNYVVGFSPFIDSEDCDFIQRMYEWTKPGGIVIARTIPDWVNGHHAIQIKFRHWLNSKNWVLRFLPKSSFKLIIIQK